MELAAKVAYYRGLLSSKLASTLSTTGAMISVNLPEQDVPEYVR